jgi:hypothetical protein
MRTKFGKGRRPASTGAEKRPGNDNLRGKEYGEGNYKASREFDEAERAFVESGKVEESARNAAPKSDAEKQEMLAAEEKARRRAKEEDPALLKKKSSR